MMKAEFRPTASALLAVVALAAGCDRSPDPVATVEIEPKQVELTFPTYETVRLRWRMEADLGKSDAQPIVFVHLLGEPGNVLRTFDHELPFQWRPGAVEEYEIKLFQSGLGAPLASGSYQLSLGLYDRDGTRWPLQVEGEEIDRFEYGVASVEVREESGEVPMFYFSPAWMPIEGGTDVQILGRRWLTGEGTIRLADISQEGSVWLWLRIPPVDLQAEELILEAPGDEQPGVLVASDCGQMEMSLAGFGYHEVEVPILADDEGRLPDECEIRFDPNFESVKLDTLDRRSFVLEVIAWTGP